MLVTFDIYEYIYRNKNSITYKNNPSGTQNKIFSEKRLSLLFIIMKNYSKANSGSLTM